MENMSWVERHAQPEHSMPPPPSTPKRRPSESCQSSLRPVKVPFRSLQFSWELCLQWPMGPRLLQTMVKPARPKHVIGFMRAPAHRVSIPQPQTHLASPLFMAPRLTSRRLRILGRCWAEPVSAQPQHARQHHHKSASRECHAATRLSENHLNQCITKCREFLDWVYAPSTKPLHQSHPQNPFRPPHWPCPAPPTSTHKEMYRKVDILQLAKTWTMKAR
jgi:hypothetical protein